MNTALITTIKPSSGYFAAFSPRAKEGEEKRSTVFAAFSLPASISALDSNGELARFAIAAFTDCVADCLRDALKAGKAEFAVPSLAECFASSGKEYLITKPELAEWIKTFADPIITSALAAKSGLPADSVKVSKKAIAYRDLLLLIASRSIMLQEQIDNAAKALEVLAASGKVNAYTENVIEGLARKQVKLNEYLAGASDDDDDIDF